MKRGIVIVLDSLGIGAMKDAEAYGDKLSYNTFLSALSQGKLSDIPNLSRLGLPDLASNQINQNTKAITMQLNERSKAKDTITGHWEMVGVRTMTPYPTFPNALPQDVVDLIEQIFAREILGNVVGSGVEVMNTYAPLHLKTARPIVYTSVDSVIQIAAHEEVIPLEELYQACKRLHDALPEIYKVARVIARPFVGDVEKGFERTPNRRDFSVKIPKNNALEALSVKGIKTYAIGKIGDIYSGFQFTESIHTKSNVDGMQILEALLEQKTEGLFFVNLVEFDSKYGHRRDAKGYFEAIKQFDRSLDDLLKHLTDEDFLIITADHGCDPLAHGSDHTREKVPFILYAKALEAYYGYKGERDSFSVIGEVLIALFSNDWKNLISLFNEKRG